MHKRRRWRLTSTLTLGAVVALLDSREGGAQAPRAADTAARAPSALTLVGGAEEDWRRTGQLLGASLDGYQFRSASSLTGFDSSAARRFPVRFAVPRVRVTRNSRLPYSMNDEALWAGRGLNAEVVAAVTFHHRGLRVILAPQLLHSQNREYALADMGIHPPIPSWRNPFASPWHSTAQSIDMPIRFGDQPITRLGAGQSSVGWSVRGATLGAGVESQWWGPGIRNALLLSNNAGGFPHLFVRTASPVRTSLGTVEGRWIAGGLTESAHFDFDPANDLRSIAVLGVSLRPAAAPDVVLGMSRAVFSATGGWGSALFGFPRVFRDVGQPNAVPGVTGRTDYVTDSAYPRGSDALIALSARWRLARSGLELYGEWARAEMPLSLRDLLQDPSHSRGYTYGMQWLASPVQRTGGRFRLQAEVTNVEQSSSFRYRDVGSWYTSRSVEQGYTERGQVLGAAVGPGSSSQWLAVDHLTPRWELGAHATRIRNLQDVASYRAYEQDVTLMSGLRARARTRYGTVSADYSSGWRLNVFLGLSGLRERNRDERNHSLTLTFAP